MPIQQRNHLKTRIIKQIPEEELAWGGEISLATIIKLEQYFGVSRSALLIRLDKIGLLRTDYSNYKKDVKKSAIEHGYSDRLYSKTDEFKVVGNYGIKAKELFDKDNIIVLLNQYEDSFVIEENLQGLQISKKTWSVESCLRKASKAQTKTRFTYNDCKRWISNEFSF